MAEPTALLQMSSHPLLPNEVSWLHSPRWGRDGPTPKTGMPPHTPGRSLRSPRCSQRLLLRTHPVRPPGSGGSGASAATRPSDAERGGALFKEHRGGRRAAAGRLNEPLCMSLFCDSGKGQCQKWRHQRPVPCYPPATPLPQMHPTQVLQATTCCRAPPQQNTQMARSALDAAHLFSTHSICRTNKERSLVQDRSRRGKPNQRERK